MNRIKIGVCIGLTCLMLVGCQEGIRNYPAPVTNAAVDMIALEDLRYFVELLTEGN